MKKLMAPLSDEDVSNLRVGQEVLINGIVYTARDAAHKRMVEALGRGEGLPFSVAGQIIYYVGPTLARPGQVIGSAGPTSSYRMDAYTPLLLSKGLKATIGKGRRSEEVIEAMKKYKAVYLGAIGGAGALLSKSIRRVEAIAYEDLGSEAVFGLEVEDFPVIVINDIYGNDFYKEGVRGYRR